MLVVAAGLGAQSGAARPIQTDVGTVDLAGAASPRTRVFEQDGDDQRQRSASCMLETISRLEKVKYVGAGRRKPADLRRQAHLRGLGRLERRDLIAPLTRFVGIQRPAATAHLALALTLRANARPDQPDAEITQAVASLIPTAPPAILGQLPYSTPDQFEAAQARLAGAARSAVRGRARPRPARSRRWRGEIASSARSRTTRWRC